jgi:hypothetical protein
VWVWGTGNEGQLGLGEDVTFASAPKIVTLPPKTPGLPKPSIIESKDGKDKGKQPEGTSTKGFPFKAIFISAGEYNSAAISSACFFLYCLIVNRRGKYLYLGWKQVRPTGYGIHRCPELLSYFFEFYFWALSLESDHLRLIPRNQYHRYTT